MPEASKVPQIIAAFAATLGALGLGTGLSWTSPALYALSDCLGKNNSCPDGSFLLTEDHCDEAVRELTDEEASWVAACFPIGAIFTAPFVAWLMNIIGRKWALISMSIPIIIGFILLMLPKYIDDSIVLFYIGRVFTGFGCGSFSFIAPFYISEMSETSIRGALASLMQMMLQVGVALNNGLFIENAVPWEIITALCLIWPVASVVAMFFIPESPYHYIKKNREEDARKSLQWLRGKQYNIDEEIEQMKRNFNEEKSIGSVSASDLITKRQYLHPFLLLLALMFFQQFCGINAVLFYLGNIFKDAGIDINPGLASFLVTFIKMCTTMGAVLTVERFGRRKLLIASAMVMAVSIASLGVFFYLKENLKCEGCDDCETCADVCSDPDNEGSISYSTVKNLGWLPLVSLIIYTVGFSFGFGPMPWVVNAEMFPKEAQSLAASLATSFNWTCTFLVSKFSTNIEDAINASGSYFLYGAICVLSIFFSYFLLPETKGKTPEDMRAYFEGGKRKMTGKSNKGFEE